jgi:hypothetical protein
MRSAKKGMLLGIAVFGLAIPAGAQASGTGLHSVLTYAGTFTCVDAVGGDCTATNHATDQNGQTWTESAHAVVTSFVPVNGCYHETVDVTATNDATGDSISTTSTDALTCSSNGADYHESGTTTVTGATGAYAGLQATGTWADDDHITGVDASNHPLGAIDNGTSTLDGCIGGSLCNTAPPTFTGNAQVFGNQLVASPGSWYGASGGFSYQWQTCDSSGAGCTDIDTTAEPDAATATYTVKESNGTGYTLRVQVTPNNGTAPADSAYSDVSLVVTGFVAQSVNHDVTGTAELDEFLSLDTPSTNLGTFIPGVGTDYFATATADATSSATTADLTIADTNANPGHLVQDSYVLASPVYTAASGTGTGATYNPDGAGTSDLNDASNYGAVSGTPVTLASYSAPISHDQVTIGFDQPIGSTEALHQGAYSKTFTLTLGQTSP